MFKQTWPLILAMDAEWVPCPDTGRALYDLPADMPDAEVCQQMWQRDREYDAEKKPRPYLKTPLCRVVSVSTVVFSKGAATLRSMPALGAGVACERSLLAAFLGYLEKNSPQLVGWNSSGADIWIMVQRALRYGLSFPGLKRPNKPWEGADYFSDLSDAHTDLKGCLSPRGFNSAALHEMAACCGIPGKLGTDGGDVYDLWAAGNIDAIVAYNEHDALTTYLVWLRAALFGGFIDGGRHAALEAALRQTLADSEREHLHHYLTAWDALRGNPEVAV